MLNEKNVENEQFFDEDFLFQQADRFLSEISGLDHFQNPKASLLLRIGGSNADQGQEFDVGPVILSKRNMQGCYVLDLTFISDEGIRKCHRAIEEYARYVDIMDGSVDEYHILSVLLMQNEEFTDGYVIAQLPVFFALTADAPGAPANTYRLSFRKDTLFYFDINQIIADELEEQPFLPV